MKGLQRLENKFSWIAIPNLTVYLVMGQVMVWLFQTFANYRMDAIDLIPGKVMHGEIWRLFTFIFYPPQPSSLFPSLAWFTNPILLFFAWWILFMMGTALERHWGSFRYTLYVISGFFFTAIATVIAMFIYPNVSIPNMFISSSIFFAFAFLYPDIEFLLFFILPIKVKWLGLLGGASLLLAFLGGPLIMKVIILGGVGNFFLFFTKEIIGRIRGAKMRRDNRERYAARVMDEDEPFHVCAICGITDRQDPDMHFVYSDGKGYCEKCVQKLEETEESEGKED